MSIQTSTSHTTDNANKTDRAEAALREVLATALTRGFYGTAGIVVSIQDGSIQNVRLTVDRRMV